MMNAAKGRPTLCFIDLDALRWNLRQIKSQIGPGIKILSMVKAGAYGHGAPAVARVLAEEGSHFFGVATVEEAVELRHGGIREPILVVAGIYEDQLPQIADNRLTPAVHDLDALKRLEAAAAKRRLSLPIHVKVDTGMGRLGFLPDEIHSWLPELKKLAHLEIQGVFSHFSHAESVQGDYTRRQLRLFQTTLARLRSEGIAPPLAHLANSAATITLPESYFDMVRPGIMLYGQYPSPEMKSQIELKPAMAWKTRILQLKKVPAGTSVSYGQTFVTRRSSLIATLPVGYADGFSRLLSNRGEVLVREQRAPVAGRVCMDLTLIDVTGIANVQQGDEVVLLGRQGGSEISADEMAEWADTISYEILTSISARVPRVHGTT